MGEIRQNFLRIDDPIKLGSYEDKPISWSYIGEIDGHDLYLCNDTLWQGVFGKTKDYLSSDARRHCLDLYDRCFSDEEKERVHSHPELNDPVFLLSKEEYVKLRKLVKKISTKIWWLRSPCPSIFYSTNYVDTDGAVEDALVDYAFPVIRPAILLKTEKQEPTKAQEEEQRDEAGNLRCIDCFDCVDCTDCIGCIECVSCKDCINCSWCEGCSSCDNCSSCLDCSDLLDRTGLKDVSGLLSEDQDG